MPIMIDLETMGMAPKGAIVSIGAVRFSFQEGVQEEFYRNVSLEDNVRCGRQMDASTVEWWLRQGKEAQASLLLPLPVTLSEALGDLVDFIGQEQGIWANGVTFDLALLRDAYDGSPPWFYREEYCLRPIRFLGAVLGVRYEDWMEKMKGTKHNALADARVQVEYLLAVFSKVCLP